MNDAANGQQGAGDQGNTGTGQQAAGQGGSGGEPPFWSTLPDNMRGETAEDTLKKLMPSWQGYHKEWSERGPAPKSADEYKLEIGADALKGYFADPNDQAVAAFKAAALDAGIPAKKFSALIEKTFAPLAEKGLLPKLVDPKADALAQVKLLGHADLSEQAKTALDTKVGEMTAWAQNVGKQMGLSETGQVELESMVLTPGGFEILMKLPGAMGQPGMKLGGEGGSAGDLNWDEVKGRLSDLRSDPRHFSYDANFHKKAEADFEALRTKYPGGPPRR